MLEFILIIGVLNFALGYGLALSLAEPPFFGMFSREFWQSFIRRLRLPALRFSAVPRPAPEPEHAEPESIPVAVPQPRNPTVATLEELPQPWQDQLATEGLQPELAIEGIIHVLWLDASLYREQLLTVESRARQSQAAENAPALERLCADLRFLNADLLRKQTIAVDFIHEHRERLGKAAKTALETQAQLADHAALLMAIDEEIHALDFRADAVLGSRRLMQELQSLLEITHCQKDWLAVALGDVLRENDHLETLPRAAQFDVATGLLNRLGVEALLDKGRTAENEHEARPTAGIIIALERLHRVNHRLGSRAGDLAIKAASRLIAQVAGESIPLATVARLAGLEFLVLAPAGSGAELAPLAETIRQSFEATCFSFQGTDFDQSITAGVCDIQPDEQFPEVLWRLRQALDAARDAGRNRTACIGSAGPVVISPSHLPIHARQMAIEEIVAA